MTTDVPALITMQQERWTVDYVGYMPDGYGEIAMEAYGRRPETIQQHIENYAYYFVAEQDKKIVGVICGDNLNESEAEIWWIHVPKTERGSGLGRALIDYFKAQLAPDIESLYVTTFDGYTPTVTFYQRVGFTQHERTVQDYAGVAVNDLRLKMAVQPQE